MLKLIVAATACAVVLGGCQTTGEPPEPPPNNYRQIVADKVREVYFDPYSMRDAEISAPHCGHNLIYGAVCHVCVRANAKNRMGAYTGLKQTVFRFKNGVLIGGDSEFADAGCAGVNYSPFTELGSASRPDPFANYPARAGGSIK